MAFFIKIFLPFMILAVLKAWRSRRGPKLPLPPGPKPHWLVGHTFQVPQKKAWLYFEKLGKEFGELPDPFSSSTTYLRKSGPIVNLNLAGDNIVVLNDPKDAEELVKSISHNILTNSPTSIGSLENALTTTHLESH
jgi:hypothetical protein